MAKGAEDHDFGSESLVSGLRRADAGAGSGSRCRGARSAGHDSQGLIAFTRGDGVYVMRADGSGVRRVWRTARERGLAWRPDGRKLRLAGGATVVASGSWMLTAPIWCASSRTPQRVSISGVH